MTTIKKRNGQRFFFLSHISGLAVFEKADSNQLEKP